MHGYPLMLGFCDFLSYENRNKDNIISKSIKLNKCKNCANYWGLLWYNTLDSNIKNNPLNAFKSTIKSLLLRNNCYNLQDYLSA